MTSLSIRIDFGAGHRLGPGKIKLLEQVAALGSISAGARAMDMSYRRAWELVETLNTMFGAPVILSKTGGKKGGGAELTPLGLAIIARYRAIELAATQATQTHLQAFQKDSQQMTPFEKDEVRSRQ